MNLPDREAGVDLIQLVALEAEVLFHARDVCISKVGAVELRVGPCQFRTNRDPGNVLTEA